MSHEEKSSASPIVVALSIVLLPLAAYVGGYFAVSEFSFVDAMVRVRTFNHHWQAKIYYPATCVESLIRRGPVYSHVPEDDLQ